MILSFSHLLGGGWFFRAILLFYLIIYALNMVLGKFLKYLLPVIVVSILSLSVCCVNRAEDVFSSGSYFAWYVYFSIFLFGFVLTQIKNACIKNHSISLPHSIIGLILSFFLYYGYLILCNKLNVPEWIRVFSVFPLYSLLFYSYNLCDSEFVLNISRRKLYMPIQFVSSLCWEIYLAQLFIVLPYPGLLTKALPLPFNLICTLILIIITAYVIKVFSRFIVQLFSRNAFDWSYMVKTWLR